MRWGEKVAMWGIWRGDGLDKKRGGRGGGGRQVDVYIEGLEEDR